MSDELDQSKRVAELKTPLGTNVLALVGFDVSEGLSELFEIRIQAVSKREFIDFDKAIGQSCTVELRTHDDKKRYYNGILTNARWVGYDFVSAEERLYKYELILRPWFWLLDQRADCRIFLDQTVKEILDDVLSKGGLGEHRFATTEEYDKIDFCVQYRETDFAFASRLMEEYGIYYFFEPADGKHTMVLADSPSSHKSIPDLGKVPVYVGQVGKQRVEQQLTDWVSERQFRTGKILLRDYNFEEPNNKLRAPKDGTESYQHSDLEVYDYPGKYDNEGKGRKFAQYRLEAEQAFDHRRIGHGDAPSLFPGGTVKVEKHPIEDENTEYLIVRANHSVSLPELYTSGASHIAETYHGTYEFLPKKQTFRALAHTPKPRIYGIQTAKVVPKKNEDGEEISTDKYGRVSVQFHWDNEPKKSCPIRVAQVWAGNNWGGIFIPRVGMEVVLEFLEGDPDRPLIVGCVYNADNEVPYELPDKKTKAGWKSQSSKGGSGYNELVFDDDAGHEKIGMHAERDHEVVIRNMQKVEIGENFQSMGNAREVTLKAGNDKLTLDTGSRKVEIAMNDHLSVGVSITLECGASRITMNSSSIMLNSPLISLNGAMVKIN